MNCLICGAEAVERVSRHEVIRESRERYLRSYKHRNYPLCLMCLLTHCKGADGDGAERHIPGHIFVPGRLDALESGVATDYLPMTEEGRLIALFRKVTPRFREAAISLLESGARWM